MRLPLIYAVLFIEGFSTIAIELIAIRQLVPAVGSNIVVTSWTIGVFLLALAIGYRRGGQISRALDSNALNRTLANAYGVSALWLSIGLSLPFVLWIFGLPAHWHVLLLAYVLLVLLVPIILLGQTIPLLATVAAHSSTKGTGEIAGSALFLSTLGSVASALLLPTVLFQEIGVQTSLALICSLLVMVALIFASRVQFVLSANFMGLFIVVAFAIVAISTNTKIGNRLIGDTAYALYEVRESKSPPLERELIVNNQRASAIGGGGIHVLAYVEALRDRLSRLPPESPVLVIGAGGFTLSANTSALRYTYVDIDPAIKGIAERHLLNGTASGTFIADDGRHFLTNTKERYQAIVLDAYTSHFDAPAHMSSVEFFTLAKSRLVADGLLVMNIIVDPGLDSDYAQRSLATIESVFGHCVLEFVNSSLRLANAIVTCKNRRTITAEPYRDDTTSSQTDFLRLSRPGT